MSVYAEYLHAETEEEREEALSGMKWEERYTRYMEELYERRMESKEDDSES